MRLSKSHYNELKYRQLMDPSSLTTWEKYLLNNEQLKKRQDKNSVLLGIGFLAVVCIFVFSKVLVEYYDYSILILGIYALERTGRVWHYQNIEYSRWVSELHKEAMLEQEDAEVI